MNQQYKPIQINNDSTWLFRIAKDSPIYLVKEDKFAIVQCEYEQPELTSMGRRKFLTGTIGLNYDNRNHNWFIKPDGTGIDGSQCLLPVEGFIITRRAFTSKYDPESSIVDLRDKINTLAAILNKSTENNKE